MESEKIEDIRREDLILKKYVAPERKKYYVCIHKCNTYRFAGGNTCGFEWPKFI